MSRPRSRSPNVAAADRSTSARSTWSASSLVSESRTAHGAAKARRETERQLQKHLNHLKQLEQRLQRLHDAAVGEISALNAVIQEVQAVRGLLEAEQERMHELVPLQSDNTTTDPASRSHSTMISKHCELLTRLAAEASALLSALSFKDQQLQYVGALVTRASDIDVQCLSERVVDSTALTNGSPLFPQLSVSDAASLMDDVTNLSTRAGRMSVQLKRAAATAREETARSTQHLGVTAAAQAKLQSQVAFGANRNVEGLRYDSGRLQKQREVIISELSAVEQRLDYIRRAVTLRLTADEAIIGTKDCAADTVVAVMRREARELKLRSAELETRLRSINARLAATDEEILRQKDRAASAQQLTDMYSTAASRCTTPVSSPRGSFSRRGRQPLPAASGGNDHQQVPQRTARLRAERHTEP